VGERIRLGLIKNGSIYSRFAQLTPYGTPGMEQRQVWKVGPKGRQAGLQACHYRSGSGNVGCHHALLQSQPAVLAATSGVWDA
jgi:hypothetical protein